MSLLSVCLSLMGSMCSLLSRVLKNIVLCVVSVLCICVVCVDSVGCVLGLCSVCYVERWWCGSSMIGVVFMGVLVVWVGVLMWVYISLFEWYSLLRFFVV